MERPKLLRQGVFLNYKKFLELFSC